MDTQAIIDAHLGGSYKEDHARRQKLNQERFKEKCRGLVREAVRCGFLTKKPCEECGEKKVHAHHEDYMQPLKVRWLCEKHHKIIHKGRHTRSS